MSYLLETSICLIIFYGLFHLLFMGKQNHMMNRIYLLSSLVLSLFIPLVSLPVYKNVVIANESNNGIRNQAITVQSSIETSEAFQWLEFLQMVYLFGVIISFSLFMLGLFKIIQMIKNGQEASVNGRKVIYNKNELPLCSFAGYILVPNHKRDNLTAYELTHEINHISMWHTMDVLLVKCLRAFYWFNPIMYLYEKRIFEVHEYQADEATFNLLGKESYLNFLVDQVSKKQNPKLVHNFNSLIKKRIIMMSSESKSGSIQYLAIIPILLVVFSLFSFDSYPEYVDKKGNLLVSQQDTIPSYGLITFPTNDESDSIVFDTIVSFNFDLKKEVKRVVARPRGQKAFMLPNNDGYEGIDTLTTLDYDTYKEQTVVINHKTGVIDTLVNEWD